MITSRDILAVACSYAIGCCTAGYYWTQCRTGKDIRTLGSGSVGASNVGRSLGASGFAVTFLFDFLKGAVVVWAAYKLHVGSIWLIACMVAVVAGHIWPVQLRFKGGKGVATSLGALCVYNGPIVLLIICVCALVFLISWRFVLSGMFAYTLTPVFAHLIGFSHRDVAAVALLSVLVVFAHRNNIREEITPNRRTGATTPSDTPGDGTIP